MKLFYYLVIGSFLLSSCSLSRSVSPGLSTPGQALSSQVSTTLTPLAEINLDGILLKSNDLPDNFIGQQVDHNPPGILQSIEGASQVIHEGIEADQNLSDGITVFLFASSTDLDNAYKRVSEIISNGSLESTSKIGEKAVIQQEGQGLFQVTSVQVVFVRCNALVYIQLFASNATAELATSYAQDVDQRISALVCR